MRLMKYVFAIIVLSIAALAQTQAPASVTTTFLNDDSLPVLGAHVAWSAVAGATYDLYAYHEEYTTCNAASPNWIELISGLTTTSYDHYPTPNSYGYGGSWCYGVAASINNVDSTITAASNPVQMGSHYYFWWNYWTPDCQTRLGVPTGTGTFTVTLT